MAKQRTLEDKPIKKTRKRPSRKLRGAGDNILLGYRQREHQKQIGFHAKHVAPAKPQDEWLEGEGHLITIAPTGTGKGRSALIPNLLSYEGPAIVIDPKGEACAITAQRRRDMGQTVHIVDPFKVVTQETASLNPFQAFDLKGVEHASVAADLAEILAGKSVFANKDQFWDLHAKALLAAMISAIATCYKDEERHFGSVRKKLKSSDAVYDIGVMLDTVGSRLDPIAYEDFASFINIVEVTRSGILTTTCSYLTPLASQAAQETLARSTIDLKAIVRGDPITIYLVIPPSKLQSHGVLFRLWTAILMMAVLSRSSRLPKYRTLFAIDEAAQLGDFELLATAYTLARSYGMRVWSFFQDIDQIKRILPHDWRTVLSSSAAVTTFGVPNRMMARGLRELFGDFTEKGLIHLPRNQMAVQRAGQDGFTLHKPDYLSDKRFAGLYEPHPMLSSKV
ncbi:MAG: type IV secretory system conjugative DNA transfer family protein [Pseudomonadota bacterium]